MTPALIYPPELLLKAQGVRVAFFDVDGVLTDGGLYFSESGESLKRFSTLDGHGLKLLQRVGIVPVVITGRDSKPLRVRLQALGIEHVHYGTEDKRPAAEQTLKTLGFGWDQCAAMGDDRCVFGRVIVIEGQHGDPYRGGALRRRSRKSGIGRERAVGLMILLNG